MLNELFACCRCKESKQFSEFHADRSKKFGISNTCKTCAKEKSAAWHANNRERAIKGGKERYMATRDAQLEYRRNWRKKNLAIVSAKNAAWKSRNRDHVNAKNREWKQRNPAVLAANSARRRASRLLATPSWANHAAILDLYRQAAELTKKTGIAWHVDHVVPIRSRLVCGLHCESNMRVIEGRENIRKSNRFWPDMPDPIKPLAGA